MKSFLMPLMAGLALMLASCVGTATVVRSRPAYYPAYYYDPYYPAPAYYPPPAVVVRPPRRTIVVERPVRPAPRVIRGPVGRPGSAQPPRSGNRGSVRGR